jgi:hypothetical protein
MANLKNDEHKSLKSCKHCSNTIDINAKVCHFCQRSQSILANFWNKIVSTITIAMLFVAIAQAILGWMQFNEAKEERIEASIVLEKVNKVLHDTEEISMKVIEKANEALSVAEKTELRLKRI